MTDLHGEEQINFRQNNGVATFHLGNQEVANFDYEGRLILYTRSGETFHRSVTNEMIKIGWDGDIRVVDPVNQDESMRIMERCYELAAKSLTFIKDQSDLDLARRIAGRSYQWAHDDSLRIGSLYKSIPVIPPDRQNSVYVEITTGCHWNRCTLCRGYEDRNYAIKSMEEAMAHIDSIIAAYGEGLKSRRSVFLGDVNALDIDQKMLLEILGNVKKKFNLPVYTAFDVFTTPKKKNMINYRDLGENGLDRVYVFLESGSYKVIRLFNKHINVTETMNLINNIKDHGIPVSIVIMAGIGGKKYSSEHVEATANIISQLALGPGDTIGLTPITEEEDTNYEEITRREGLMKMSIKEKYDQMNDLTSAIQDTFRDINGRELKIPVVKYDLREGVL